MINPVLIERDTMTSIGNAIRNKGGATTPLTPGQMPAAINNISGGSAPCIITGNTLVGCVNTTDTSSYNDWDKIKNLIDYENVIYLNSMFSYRRDLKIREIEEFFSYSMPNLSKLPSVASYTIFSDSDIETHVVDLTLDSPNCTAYNQMFSKSGIYHLKLTILEHNVDFTMTALGYNSTLRSIEIKGPGLNHLTSLYNLCYENTSLQTLTIGDDDTDYSKLVGTDRLCPTAPLKTFTIKGINVLPLASTSSIPSTIESIKVPAALVNTYKNATNWSAFANKISAI